MMTGILRGLTLAAVLVSAWSIGPAARAEMVATPVTGDSRLVEFEYDKDNVYLVVTRPKRSTFVRFGGDEKITYVSTGDSKDFDISVAASFEFLEIKPKWENSETNVTVVTTKRTYHLIARSTFDGGRWYARGSWRYPEVALLDLTRQAQALDVKAEQGASGRGPVPQAPEAPNAGSLVAVDRLNFKYTIKGDAPFKPSLVFDDGKFTFIKLPEKLQELPAMFRAESDDPSQMALVAYEVKEDHIVAQRLMKTIILKLGKSEVRIEAVEPSRRLFNFGSAAAER